MCCGDFDERPLLTDYMKNGMADLVNYNDAVVEHFDRLEDALDKFIREQIRIRQCPPYFTTDCTNNCYKCWKDWAFDGKQTTVLSRTK